ncbi:N utilization substance protein B-like protein [Candidatus Blochmanniella vafra str. BVAF]|uniref:Transcription antitermination protein NusB n=1 Tax=Blochmanniella vafra (strain BVAF) TaxID=859654 RepID=E8Q619_BLOVB|nr:transcription antitermination factor NusB [Candidatus Blochmannia vafer]ADV33635.1 N utilization substance protein B-like protein [Candidatus Blochmannia vafer str. BVAF]
MKFITRRLARLCALQALYSWQFSKNDLIEIENYIVSIQNIQNFDISYFRELYIGVINCISDLDKLMIPYLFRDLKTIGYVEYSVLLIALFELTQCYDIPYKVVMNEAIELAKIFGSEKSYKFINGVLNKIVTEKLFIPIK